MMFSIIMPVWNRADIVEKAVESVLSQTYEDYELIIIDDGSEDNLEMVIRPYLSNKVKYHKISHGGVSAARNHGIKFAKGDFLAYLDSDNIWHREFLSTMHDYIVQCKAEAAYCMYKVYRKYPLNQKIYLHHVGGEEFNYTKLLDDNYIDLNAFVHSRKIIEDVGFFDNQLKRFVDWDIILRISSSCEPVFIPLILVDYYENIIENTITLTEDIATAHNILKKKHQIRKSLKKTIIIEHDAIQYLCEDVSEKKYDNWMLMNHPEINTIDFTSQGYPYILQIEPTNTCNLSCPLCPVGRKELTRQPRHMKLKEFKAIIDDMEQYLLFLVLWDSGEPFMNPELPEMIKYATERKIKTVTSTNAHFLQNEEYVKRILTSGLSNLIVAIDSLDEDNYKSYRKKGDLDKTIFGIKNLIRLKKELNSATSINLRMVVMKQNEHQLSEIRKFAKNLEADVFTVKTANPSCGVNHFDEDIIPSNPKYRRYQYKNGTYERVRINTQCERIWNMSNIFSNGDVVPCTYDYNAELKIGNIHENPFSEIWNSTAYRNVRKKIFCDKDSIPKCRECTINFKLSNSGWFVETHNFNIHIMDKRLLLEKLLDRENQIRKLENTIVELNNSIALRLARKIPFGPHLRRFLMQRDTIPTTSKTSWIKHLNLPLEENKQTGWKPYHIYNGSICHLDDFGCHISVLSPGNTPHEIHSHPEEELLIMLSGELEIVLQDRMCEHKVIRERINPGTLVFYQASQPHTIVNAGKDPATYLMFKWHSNTKSKKEFHLENPILHYNSDITHISSDSKEKISYKQILESPTRYLQKLQCHLTTLKPGASYPPHPDLYNVAIILLDGVVETLGRRVTPLGIIFYAAGEPHGIKNVGDVSAHYLVFEFHCNDGSKFSWIFS